MKGGNNVEDHSIVIHFFRMKAIFRFRYPLTACESLERKVISKLFAERGEKVIEMESSTAVPTELVKVKAKLVQY